MLFYPDPSDEVTAESARQICAVCPVRDQCLQFALDSGEQYGIWGGRTPIERRSMHRRAQRERIRARRASERRIGELLAKLGPGVVKP